ncbi:uncharacterized protein LOC125646748 isoform X1 [Ostrea edulis]|uniref:uncharacterized protein LOC125646748 isoform X1 n=1 Tax=Ostrea edulis TaxID=37623 RepID=UPI0024AF0C49|nr:uncharacterized protein LOC125646748 isoform X1 [Ostrea edulis]
MSDDKKDFRNEPPPQYQPNQGNGYPPQYQPPQQYAPQYTDHPGFPAGGYSANTVVLAPGPMTMNDPPPPDYMNRAIFVTICCFWPTGIFAIMKASESRSAYIIIVYSHSAYIINVYSHTVPILSLFTVTQCLYYQCLQSHSAYIIIVYSHTVPILSLFTVTQCLYYQCLQSHSTYIIIVYS